MNRMRKIENITNVLKFYMAVNKLKETTKGESSRADNIFGSSILAIAFNSEFNNASNLANIIKMELLLNRFFHFWNMSYHILQIFLTL